MSDQYLVLLFTLLALMLFVSYLLHFGLDKFRIPHLLAPLLVGFILQLLPLSSLTNVASGAAFSVLAQFGIMFLLFLVGFQLNAKLLRSLSVEIALLAILNLAFSSILGLCVLVSFGYPPFISVLVSTALATVAEATIAPILDELGVIKTKIANLIVGPGIFDDVAEVMIASLASVMVGADQAAANPIFLMMGFLAFVAFALVFHRFIIPLIARFDRAPKDTHLFLLIVCTALIFTAISQNFRLGVLLGAIVAGLASQRFQNSSNADSKAFTTLRAVTYGFLGPVFFFGIGLSVNISSFVDSFQLTLWLLAANFIGKFLAALIVGKMIKLNLKAIAMIGLGLSAKFSMGIIPVQIFYAAKIIDQQLFSAFVGVSAITTMIVPFTLAYVINRWTSSVC